MTEYSTTLGSVLEESLDYNLDFSLDRQCKFSCCALDVDQVVSAGFVGAGNAL